MPALPDNLFIVFVAAFSVACADAVTIDLNEPPFLDTSDTSTLDGDSDTPSPDDLDTSSTSDTDTGVSITPPPFCEFSFGMLWQDYLHFPTNLSFISIWVGYENELEGDLMNPYIVNLLEAVGPGSTESVRGAVPVYYAYFAVFKADVIGGLGGCDDFLCGQGARWVRDNRDYLINVYSQYARLTGELYGYDDPLIWLVEPGLSAFSGDDQEAPLSYSDLGLLVSDIIDEVKWRMPNAVVSLFNTPSVPDVAEYWSNFDLSKVDIINTTGMGDNNGYLNTWDNQGRSDGTYAYIHRVTGKHLLVDNGFGATLLPDDWSIASPKVINQRIEDGVFAVHLEFDGTDQNDISNVADNIDRLRPDLNPVSPECP